MSAGSESGRSGWASGSWAAGALEAEAVGSEAAVAASEGESAATEMLRVCFMRVEMPAVACLLAPS